MEGDEQLIYAVDFDGTLCENKWPQIGEPNKGLIDFLMKAKTEGHEVILYTMREGTLLDEALKWCESRGIMFDAVNDNLPRLIEQFGVNSRKIYADLYIDDHNVADGFFYNNNLNTLPYHEWRY